MLIATVIGKDNEILPIVMGDKLRIYDRATKQYKDFKNPALNVNEGRRSATLQLALELGASVFVAPPETFCDLSYQKAKQADLKFLTVNKGLSFEQFVLSLREHRLSLLNDLPETDIVPS